MPDIKPILCAYPAHRENLIPMLHEVQRQAGYLRADAIRQVAEYLSLTPSVVYGVATFYSAFKFVPSGKRIIKVCRGTACHVKGAEGIVRELEKRLCIKEGETTADGKFTLLTEACFGSCALAPVVVSEKVYGRVTPAGVERIMKGSK